MSENEVNSLIAALQDKQRRVGWSDRRMARELGVSPSQWHRVKAGERPVSVQIMRAAVQSGIGSAVLSFLEAQLPVPNKHANNQQPEAE